MKPRPPEPDPVPDRRSFLMTGVTILAMAGLGISSWRFIDKLRTPDFDFKPYPDLPGFRQLEGGPVSRGVPALVGLDPSERPQIVSGEALCAALFSAPRQTGDLPIAYFSDYRCSICRQVSPRLHALQDSAPVAITWHELPLLGAASLRAARAALAARKQGAYDAFHNRLMDSPFLPNNAYLRAVAGEEGANPDQLIADMEDLAVTRQLGMTAALASRFGFFGTPALVVGRTAFMGDIGQRQLKALIELEQQNAATLPCPVTG
ncbi:Protein-disulfide isomerase [Roseovarius pacificus]|uniref:Protein-disulfide isomerase n=2 Tax=Roseovarius pacificus TaxID=337701 RepID=A0A1M7BIB1_9RHOB|nr:Protein-disulfide isomerase [Roseovarius pacificus]